MFVWTEHRGERERGGRGGERGRPLFVRNGERTGKRTLSLRDRRRERRRDSRRKGERRGRIERGNGTPLRVTAVVSKFRNGFA